jgi:hypothetical protein
MRCSWVFTHSLSQPVHLLGRWKLENEGLGRTTALLFTYVRSFGVTAYVNHLPRNLSWLR